jgi:hypothetical protein
MGLFLNREKLLQKQALKIEKVDLGKDEESGEELFVYVKEMTGREKDTWERSIIVEKKNEKGETEYDRNLANFRARLAVFTLCDETGKRLLQDSDIGTLSDSMGAKRLDKIMQVAQKLNSVTEEDKAVLVKNSAAGLDANSSSGSVEN